MKKVAILQSNYIPWKGYFDLINSVDEFIIYDSMQFTRRDWRNRNKIKTKEGLQWLSIPVNVKGNYFQTINETTVCDNKWIKNHINAIHHSYRKAKCFEGYLDWLQDIYSSCINENRLSKINRVFIRAICDVLKINTKISFSEDFVLLDGKTERLIGLCKDVEADYYLSGPAAKDYIVDSLFQEAGIELSYIDYSGYPIYTQLHGGFEHGVSIIDLILNEGENARSFMKSFRDNK